MDRPIEHEKWPVRKVLMLAGAGIVSLGLIYLVAANSGSTELTVEADRLSVAQVRQGEFREYVPINGSVQPQVTFYLDVEEGGIVEKIHVEGGSSIRAGDLILVFSNATAQKQNIETETRLLENLDQLRNSKLSLTQSSLILKDQLLDVSYKIRDLEKTYRRYQQLMQQQSSQISKEQFETIEYQLNYYRSKRELLQERIRRETELQEQQTKQIDSSVERIDLNLKVMSRIIDSLEVRAPIDGYLSTLSAEVGQSLQRGERIGQVDQLDKFKVRGQIDQFYITRVTTGQRGSFEFGGRRYELEVVKIYPEVEQDVFQVDMAFQGEPPQGIKRGQTLNIDLGLSEAKTTNVVAKGGFYGYTSGRWAYVLARDGRSARRRNIVLGRQNPQFVEVLEGLEPGEWIITSSYENFNDVDELEFPEPIKR